MRVAMIIDDERLTHEQAMLNRLCVGLIDEGAQIVRIIPELSDVESQEEREVSLAERIFYPPNVLPWMRRHRISRLIEQLDRYDPQVVYAVGEQTWAIAPQLAKELETPLAIDVWSAKCLPRFSRRSPVRERTAYVCATEPIAKMMRKRVGRDSVAVVPQGVPVPKKYRRAFSQAESVIALAILGRSFDATTYRPLMSAISRFTLHYPQLRCVVELDGPREHEVWRLVRQAGLLDRVSTIVKSHLHRRLLSQCDALLLPEPRGELRTIVLDIMAAGVPVIAVQNRAVDLFIAEKTALIVSPTTDSWAQALQRLLQDHDEAARLGEAAREAVMAGHRTSRQVSELYGVFDQMLTGGAIAFSPVPPA